MNEVMYMPFMVLVILGTALLSAVVTTALPHVPKWWDALKSRIKRKSTPKSSDMDMVDVIIVAKLTERVDDLQKQIDNLVEVKYNRDRNRKNNIRRDVRDYLKELQK
jgi:hypothetical protein